MELFQQSLVFLKMFKLKTLRAFCFHLREIFFSFDLSLMGNRLAGEGGKLMWNVLTIL